MPHQLFIGLIFSIFISLISFRAGFLTTGGSVAQFILGTILLGLGGWAWTIPMLTFFILSSAISKLGKAKKRGAELNFEKSSTRDAYQVLANGGVAGIATLLYFFWNEPLFYIAYLGSVSAAVADTWGTEIGILSRSTPVLVTTFRKVEPGTSGAVSIIGSISGIAGAFVVWMSALFWLDENAAQALLPVVGGGAIGTLADSFLGATLQAEYRCLTCSERTERRHHCGNPTEIASGIAWLRNDAVNLVGSLTGALVSVALYFFR